MPSNIPTEPSATIIDVPPYDTNGSVIPVAGINLQATAILNRAWTPM